jgi:hypothetical protein
MLGFSGNAVLDRLVKAAGDDIRGRRAEGQHAVLRGYTETCYAAKSWTRNAAPWRGSEASASK